ncbi:MAG: glucose 1-dehydrogenase [candidate division KSB1 bacterium]|nr:glucose 1-dehydrogenase [candidate division KSB1 bacterium]
MAGRLVGKVALVTGAAGGIGAATVRRFCSEGARVLSVDRDVALLERMAAELRASGAEVECYAADVSREEDCVAMVRRAEERFGALHVLFNNAGIFPDEDGSVTETSEEVLDRVLAVNVKGVFFGCKHGIPALLRAGGGSIINTASFVALMGAATSQSAYTASKGAVLSLTREIAVEYARKGIRANALCPGPVNTPLLASLLADPARRARRLVHIPMGRLAEADEIARAVVFLASDESSYITGTAFVVDGGITAAYVTPE